MNFNSSLQQLKTTNEWLTELREKSGYWFRQVLHSTSCRYSPWLMDRVLDQGVPTHSSIARTESSRWVPNPRFFWQFLKQRATSTTGKRSGCNTNTISWISFSVNDDKDDFQFRMSLLGLPHSSRQFVRTNVSNEQVFVNTHACWMVKYF